ncbi:MAG: hypothetical protein LBT53_01170 [Puniceicoccales bacterium]|nr:hypothetical protein [Puniceicoccales bacterium]
MKRNALQRLVAWKNLPAKIAASFTARHSTERGRKILNCLYNGCWIAICSTAWIA